MNMRKNDRRDPLFSPMGSKIMRLGLVLIYLSLFRLIFEITASAPFTAAAAEDFGRMLEYPVAALMLLTASVFLVEKIMRQADT
ncbi:MAG: hypothetical protein IJX39_07535 [Clostridia bacterium]|nr:hypothetical protein [Clostridia bacterium]